MAITPGSQLHSILKKDTDLVNALHDQAIDEIGHNLHVVARDKAMVVQAIEHSDAPFVIGVQWHPEYLPQIAHQQQLFFDLVNSAKQFIKSEHTVS